MGLQFNNNTFDNSFYVGYNINKPKGWYNRIGGNINGYWSRLASPIDPLKQQGHMFQEYFMAMNFFGQTKKLWSFYANFNNRVQGNDYYEARKQGRVFKRGGRTSLYMNVTSNEAKKYSFSPEFGLRWGRQFEGTFGFTVGLFHSIRLSQKFSINHGISYESNKNQAGFTDFEGSNILFAKRDINTIQNTINVKYSFTNKMGLTLNVRHYWSGVRPTELLLLNTQGYLEKTNLIAIVTTDYNRNFNSFALNMIYTWQVANGSFLNIVWQDEAFESVRKDYEENYFTNVKRTFNVNNANTISVKLVYFLDYLHLKKRK